MTRHFLSGGGICGQVARDTDWSRTPLGPVESWPQSLKTTVGILLNSRHPMFLWWGPELVQIYNDAYLPSFGVGKHPAAMGQCGRDGWQEIWPIIWPQIDDVMQRGKASWNEDHLVPIFRNGGLEEVYWTYGYSPVLDEEGGIGGTLVVCTETTGRVVAARRLAFVRTLALALAGAEDSAQVTRIAAECLAGAAHDVPFAVVRGYGLSPVVVGIESHVAVPSYEGPAEQHTLPQPIHAGPWPEAVREVFAGGLEGGGRTEVSFGLSPRLPFDAAYRSFLRQIVEQIASAQARAAVETERRRLLAQAPVATALITGPEHVFELANPLYVEMVGREVVGKKYLEAFPEHAGSEVFAILERVYRTGEPFVTHELEVALERRPGEAPEQLFFKFNLEPIRNVYGNVYGMMAVAVDITKQVLARQTLEQTHVERGKLLLAAQAAARAKDEFLAMLGHELRNPLAPIITALQLMKAKGGEQTAREQAIIQRQATHLVHLVDDLLDVSRVAEGKIELNKQRVALAQVVSRAAEVASPLLENKRHKLELKVPSTGFDVDADLVRLTQVVANLLTNAARYTDPGGRISVVARHEGARIVLRVADNGAGIAATQLPRLFEAFFQGPRARDRAEGGLGLGLALVKSLVELHGGEVSAHSEGPGRGSVFELRLKPAVSGPDQPAAVDEGQLELSSSGVTSGQRVLLVDDNEDIADLFSSLLRMVGFQVATAPDGPTALEVASKFRPEVAVLDIGLPVMDGYELALRLRELLGDAPLRLIAVSGYGQHEDRERSASVGFHQHLVKPVDARSLVAAIGEQAIHALS